MEGYLTQEFIYDAYYNFVNSVLKGNENLGSKAQKFINDQLNWIDDEVKQNKGDPYWELVEGLMAQLKGMHKGYLKKAEELKKTQEILDLAHFYYLTNMGDLGEIIPAFEACEKNEDFHECSGFVKLLENDLVTSHNTHNM